MADDVVCQNLGSIQLRFYRCSTCGAFLALGTALKGSSVDSDYDAELCEPCALAQVGSDEFV
jgi:hypothetical protein